MPEALAAALIGFLAGILSGLFGIGGALLTIPALRLTLEAPGLVAVGTSLAVVVPTALAGALAHRGRGSADVRAGVVMGLAGAPFAAAGAWGASLAGATVVLVSVSIALAYAAVRMWRPSPSSNWAGRTHAPAGMGRLLVLGALAGTAAGFMGLGGGFVIVPALVLLFGFPIRRAAGTSLVAIALLATPGAIVHAALGHVDAILGAGLAIGMVPAALLGAKLAHVGEGTWLRRAFAVGLALMAGALAFSELGVVGGG